MQSDRRIGIELPKRTLVWRDGDATMVGYNDPLELVERYDIAAHRETLERMASLLAELAAEAAG